MSIAGSIHYTWNSAGEISYVAYFPTADGSQIPSSDIDVMNALGAVWLVDHVLATVSSELLVDFVEVVLHGVAGEQIVVKPVKVELKEITLEFHRGNILYTTLKSKKKLFANNAKLEQGIVQMVENTISTILANSSKENADGIKFAVMGIIATYEMHLRKMIDEHIPALKIRAYIAKAITPFVMKFPASIHDDDLQKHIANIESQIQKWKALSLRPGRSIFYL